MLQMPQAHIIQTIVRKKEMTIREWERTCFLQTEITKIQHFIIQTNPQGSGKYIHHNPGVLVHVAGDALEVSNCLPVNQYTIIYNRTYNGQCYTSFPVLLPNDPQPRFLQIADRKLVTLSHKISCVKKM